MKFLLVGTALCALTVSGAQAQSQTTTPLPGTAAQDAAYETFQVFFPLDSAELDAGARQTILQAADNWRQGGSGQISLTGYTDTSGAADYNLRLSERRAKAVEDALVSEGVLSSQIETTARGEGDLLVSTSDDVRESENRRVEIVVPAAVEERTVVVAPPPPPEPETPVRAAPEAKSDTDPFTFALGPVYGYNYGENENGADNNLFGVELTFRALPGFLGGVSLSQMGLWSYNGIDDGLTGRTVASLDFAPDFGIVRPTLAVNGGLVYGEAVKDGFVVGPELRFDVAPIAGFNIGLKAAYDYQFESGKLDEGILWGGLDLGIRF